MLTSTFVPLLDLADQALRLRQASRSLNSRPSLTLLLPWPLEPKENHPDMVNRGVCPTVLDGESITTAAFLRRSTDE
eukprot:scaffold28378_cov223-Skeletonema_marinoi.AAC.4